MHDINESEDTESIKNNDDILLNHEENSESTVTPSTSLVPDDDESILTSDQPPLSTYTYTDMAQTMYVAQDVNVRDLPGIEGKKIGGLKINQEIQVTGQCNESGWYRFN